VVTRSQPSVVTRSQPSVVTEYHYNDQQEVGTLSVGFFSNLAADIDSLELLHELSSAPVAFTVLTGVPPDCGKGMQAAASKPTAVAGQETSVIIQTVGDRHVLHGDQSSAVAEQYLMLQNKPGNLAIFAPATKVRALVPISDQVTRHQSQVTGSVLIAAVGLHRPFQGASDVVVMAMAPPQILTLRVAERVLQCIRFYGVRLLFGVFETSAVVEFLRQHGCCVNLAANAASTMAQVFIIGPVEV